MIFDQRLRNSIRTIGRKTKKIRRDRILGPRIVARGEVVDTKNLDVFGKFETSDGREIDLYEGYRDSIKRAWRIDNWPSCTLKSMDQTLPIPEYICDFLKELESSRTLPAPVNEIADMVYEMVGRCPEAFIVTDYKSGETLKNIVAARRPPEYVQSAVRMYRNNAYHMAEKYRHWSGRGDLSRVRSLETGCGVGYSTLSMAELGVAEAVGIDTIDPDYRWAEERPRAFECLNAAELFE